MLGNLNLQVTVDLATFTGYANWTFQQMSLVLKSNNRKSLFWNKKHVGGTRKAGCTLEKAFVIGQSIWRFDQQQNVEPVAGYKDYVFVVLRFVKVKYFLTKIV